MPSLAPHFEAGQSVLVAAHADDAPWRLVVDLVQAGHITLATVDNEKLPAEWHALSEVHVTALDRFNVHLVHVPVVRVGETRIVIGEPDSSRPATRRAYARISSPAPVSCMLLDFATNSWVPFTVEVRDLGGGGCSVLADRTVADGTIVVLSFVLDGSGPIVVVGRVLPREDEDLPTIGRVLARLEFVLIREAERDRILRFILLSLAGRRHAQTAETS